MKNSFGTFLLLVFAFLFEVQVFGQHSEGEQYRFSVEEIPGEPRVTHSVPIPEGALATLHTDEAVQACLKDNPLERGQSLSSWFIGSVIHLDGTNEVDLIVLPSFRGQESMCFQTPAGIGLFWILKKNSVQYRLILKTWGGGLEILRSKTNGFRDVRTGTLGQAGRNLTTVTFHFNGSRYVPGREATTKQ